MEENKAKKYELHTNYACQQSYIERSSEVRTWQLLIPRKTSTLFQFFFQFESSKYAYYGTRRLCQPKTHQYGLFFKHAIVEN